MHDHCTTSQHCLLSTVPQVQSAVRALHTGANTAAISAADERTNPSGTTGEH